MRSKPILAAVLFALVTLTLHGQAPVFSPPQGNASKNSTSPQVFNGQIRTPQLVVGVAATTALQTVRGIVAASYGPSTSNAGTYLDIFPFGYNPWLSGITFEDYATNHLVNLNSGAINLGLADNNNNSQGICFTASRTTTFDSLFCLYAHSAQLTWNATGDAVVLGSGTTTSADTEYGFAARVGLDGPNGNAVLAGGGSAKAAVGAALAGNNATFAGTYFFLCVINGTCGAGIQKTDPTLDNWFVTLAGAETTVSIKVGTGTVISRYARYSAVLTPAAVAANTCAAQSFTVTNAVAGDFLIGINKPTEQAGLSVTPGHVSGAGTATMNFCNNTASPITPTAGETYQFVVVQ